MLRLFQGLLVILRWNWDRVGARFKVNDVVVVLVGGLFRGSLLKNNIYHNAHDSRPKLLV
jgi:sugar (pentulose or hexulose) kinase